MHRIYQQSTQAIVWLGNADATSSTAIDFLISLDDMFQSCELRKSGQEIFFADLGRHGLPKKADPRWSYLVALLVRPWFFRIWVLQEVVFAPSASVHCGEAQVPWVTVTSFIVRLCSNPTLEQHLVNISGPFPHGLFTIARILLLRSVMPTRSISDVLQHTNRQIATDLHDKVYAIMGFLSEETRLIPDYSLSVEDLFLEVARTALRAGDLSILRSAGTLSKRTLPSWVPDWSIDFNDIPEPIFRREHNFTSSGDSEAILAWSENKKLLGVRVTFIDNLDQGPDTLLPFPILENPWYGSPELKREWAQKTGIFIGSEWKLSSRCLPAVGPAAIEESLWRALTMESMGNGFPADNSFGKYFKIFFRDLKWHWIIEHGHLG